MTGAADHLASLAIDRRAPVERLALDGHSWVDLVRGFVRDAAGALERFHDSPKWSQHEVLRYDRYVPEQRLGAGFRVDSDPLLRQIGLHLCGSYRQPLEGAAGVLYRTGDDFQGLHSDRELKWLDETLVGITVLGVRRPFVLRPRGSRQAALADRVPAGDGSDDVVLTPGEGDLLVMGGRCQADWLHGVPAVDTPLARISLTWRWTARAGRPDLAPGYFDGRQFSDRPRQRGHRTAHHR